MNDCYLEAAGKNGGKEFIGPQLMLHDSWRMAGWDLLTHGGFLTYPHHDASGLCTYVTIRSGSKIWCYLDVPGSASMSRDALFRAWDGLFADNIGLEFTRRARPGTIVLERGDTL